FDVDAKLEILQEEEAKTLTPTFWDNPKEAEKVLNAIKSKKIWTDSYAATATEVDDLTVLFEFYQAGEATESEVEESYQQTIKAVEELEFKNMLSADEDQLSAV